MKRRDTFNSLRKGDLVDDSWYGNGRVLALKRGRAVIKLVHKNAPWEYDRLHVNHFVKKIK
jgi:hypothetical protein